ncbi:MAG: slipin family protein, partial [Bdellovibrionales bacterium]|nr:slipin family protein [Bdellovibrionales bacterium]
VEYLDITAEQEIPSEKFKTMVKRDPNSDQFLFVQVPESHVGIVYIDGRLTKTIEAGSYAYWVGRADIYVQILDLRFQNMEVGGQEILTADRVSLRLNFEAFYRIVDPLKMVREAKSIDEFLYKEFQFALRRYVGQKTLDEILGDKENLSEALTTEVAEKASSVGVELKSAGIKDVILPGGMKEILNQVVAAEKAAQANLIRRREEVAATRSLLNTAKMIDSNPTLMRLKELKTLEKLADKVDSIQVGGGVQGLLEQLRKGG